MVFFSRVCYNNLSKNRKVDAKMDYQKWAQEVAQKIKIKERHDVAALQGNR